MSSDAQIAREWAERVAEEPDAYSFAQRAAARHILATTTPPTMADMTEDEREACQWMQGRDESGDLLVIACVRREHCDVIYRDGVTTTAMHDQITPLPDLPRLKWPTSAPSTEDTPRREPEPESTPDHPAVLATEADYESAPVGTIVAAEAEEAWTKCKDGSWETWGIISGYNVYKMADGPRRVLRWGWEA